MTKQTKTRLTNLYGILNAIALKEGLSIIGLARIINKSYDNTFRVVSLLLQEGILTKNKEGRKNNLALTPLGSTLLSAINTENNLLVKLVL